MVRGGIVKTLKIPFLMMEESKSFYITKIQSFLEDPSIKPPFSLFETSNKNNMGLYAVIGSLIMRYFLLGFDEIKDSEVSEEEIELFKKSEVMKFFIGFIYSLLTTVNFSKSWARLYLISHLKT